MSRCSHPSFLSSTPLRQPKPVGVEAGKRRVGIERRVRWGDRTGSFLTRRRLFQVGVIYRLPLGSARDIRRSGKKKTICELQEEEKMLLEEKMMLQKEVELGRQACRALQLENKRLKSRQSSLLSEGVPTTITTTTTASIISSGQNPDSQFLLPDLNEPLSDNLG